jgi:hypothetical protein
VGDVGLQDRVDILFDDWFGGTQTLRCTDYSIDLSTDAPFDYFIDYSFSARLTDNDLDATDPDYP